MWRQGLDFTCLDIGAHLGAFSIPFGSFAKDCGKRVPIYAFEPSPEVFPLLKRSIQINQMDDICTGVNAAVADATHPVEFIVFDQLSTVSSGLDAAVLHFGNRPNHRVAVEGVSIDDFVKEKAITSHLVCKIDTEGWDLKVVDGMRRCIEDRLVVMQLEFTPGLLESYTDPIERLESLSLDYVLMEVVLENDLAETGVRRIGTKRSDLEAFVERAKATPFRCEDVLALPKSMQALPELVERLHEDRTKQMEHRARQMEERARQMEERARQMEERARQMEEERNSLENRLARFMISRSWQITRPLRVGRGLIRQHISPHFRYFRHQESA
jgi:FkbM family methyltransferase